MKYFLISNMYPSADSPGYGIFVKNVAEELAENGIEMSAMAVISGRSKGKWAKIRKYVKFFAGIVKGFFSDYDFIYIHFPNQVIPLLKVLYRVRQPKIIVNFHGEDLLYSSRGVHQWLGRSAEEFCRKYASGIVVPSPYFANIVAERRIINKDRIIVSPSGGINEKFFRPKTITEVVRGSDKPLHLGYVGRLDPGKGILEFLEVIKCLKEKGMDYRATIIGYGCLHDAAMDFVTRNNLDNCVSFIQGVPQSELPRYYQNFDLLLFLSSGESLGLAGIESMACGTPVIGSTAGGIVSYLIDGRNGYIISDISNANHIADVIRKYVGMPDGQKYEMYINSEKTGAKYYSHDVCRKLAADLTNVLEGDTEA